MASLVADVRGKLPRQLFHVNVEEARGRNTADARRRLTQAGHKRSQGLWHMQRRRGRPRYKPQQQKLQAL
jgi:hypothetical protein